MRKILFMSGIWLLLTVIGIYTESLNILGATIGFWIGSCVMEIINLFKENS